MNLLRYVTCLATTLWCLSCAQAFASQVPLAQKAKELIDDMRECAGEVDAETAGLLNSIADMLEELRAKPGGIADAELTGNLYGLFKNGKIAVDAKKCVEYGPGQLEKALMHEALHAINAKNPNGSIASTDPLVNHDKTAEGRIAHAAIRSKVLTALCALSCCKQEGDASGLLLTTLFEGYDPEVIDDECYTLLGLWEADWDESYGTIHYWNIMVAYYSEWWVLRGPCDCCLRPPDSYMDDES